MLGFAKAYLVPGSTGFLLIAVSAGVALLYVEPARRWGRRLLTGVLVLYLVLAMPWVSGLLQRGSTSPTPPITRADQVSGIRTIVVLGNGVVTFGPPGRAIDLPGRGTTRNVLEAVRLYRLIPSARIVASGGMPPGGAGRRPESDVMRDYLLQLGVAAGDILLDRTSVNTHQQAVNLARLLPPGERVLLVTAPSHMRRSLMVFRTQGLDPIAAPRRGAVIAWRRRRRRWLPSSRPRGRCGRARWRSMSGWGCCTTPYAVGLGPHRHPAFAENRRGRTRPTDRASGGRTGPG